jgi:predicted acylesterase/phospholipase RssA
MKAANSIVADRKRTKASQMPKIVNLALQDGGGHGARSPGGMLDRLLEEEALHFEGIAGTSAGAVNAVVQIGGFRKAIPHHPHGLVKDDAFAPPRSPTIFE